VPVVAIRCSAALLSLAMATTAAVGVHAAAVNAAPVVPVSPLDANGGASSLDKRIAALRAEIARHNKLYFEKAAPEITDAQFDELKRELVRLEQGFPDAAKASPPVAEIGDDRTEGFKPTRHREPMLSLAKAYTEDELRTFLARVRQRFAGQETTFVIEPKFDGLAISVTYQKGELVRAVTRGNGHVGDDVTANVRAISNLPSRLRAASTGSGRSSIPDLIEIRGEIFVGNGEFARINREREAAGDAPFAHPRNLAAGTLKQQDPGEVTARGLEAVFYGWGAVVPESATPATQSDFHRLIRAWGLPGVKDVKQAATADQVWAAVKALGERRARLAFPTDGAVVKLDAVAQQRELGASDFAPRWAMAYKFPAERTETTLRAITLQVGRSGVITPVAELAPVRLAGTTITRASLYNRDEIARRDLRIGDTVVLEKAGEIVPAIVGVNLARRPPQSTPFAFPETCPACGGKLEQDDGGNITRCVNRDCPPQVRRRLEHFASKDAADISGLGPATIEELVAKGWVKEIPDLYRLRREDLLTLGRNVGPSTDRLLAAIETSKQAGLARIVYGLGIPRIGPAAARAVAQSFGSLRALAVATPASLDAQQSALRLSLGESAADALIFHLRDEKNRALIEQLVSLGVQPVDSTETAAAPAPGPLAGKTFVLAGTLRAFSRQEATTQIENAGGSVSSIISRKVDFVVTGADDRASRREAEKLGVKSIDEAGLLRLLEKK
jgi:DNA ligase (NAD+)